MMGGRVSGGDVGKLNVIHCASKPAKHRVFKVLKLSGYYMYHKVGTLKYSEIPNNFRFIIYYYIF